jgi:hypothetical protein
MRLERLQIWGFGRLHDIALEFDPALTLVAGPNEAGKSTVKDCLLRMLFGFPEFRYDSARRQYEPRNNGARFAATLAYRLDNGRAYEISRDFSRADVPTDTVEADTRRQVPELCGNRSTSPGEVIFGLSLPAYRQAAVVSAGDIFDERDSDAIAEIGEQLASIVGSGADASASEAIDSLRQFARDIGERGLGTPLGKASAEADAADRELARYLSDYRGFETRFAERAKLEASLRDLSQRRERCSAGLATARLRSLQAKLAAAGHAKAEVDAALARRDALGGDATPPPEKRRAIEAAIQSVQLAEHSSTEAAARSGQRQDDRAKLQSELDAQTATLMEKRSAAAHLEQEIARAESAATASLSEAEVAALERESDEVDLLESRERNLSAKAGIARQRHRPSALAAVLATLVAIALIAVGISRHDVLFTIPSALMAVAAGALIARFVAAGNRRAAAIRDAESQAAAAQTEYERAAAVLASRCRAAGCPDMMHVRAARSAQGELARLRAEAAAASQAAALVAEKRDAMAKHLADISSLQTEADEWADQRRSREAALAALLDDAGIAPGPLTERVSAYLTAAGAAETAARADAAVAEARAALDRTLAGLTIESLEEEAGRLATGGAAGGDAGEYADRDADSLARTLADIDDEMHETERMLEGAKAAITEFERTHRDSLADLEEAAALRAQERERLKFNKRAAETAWQTIEQVKDAVHRDFTPRLNEALERSSTAITARRYEHVYVDQNSLALRVIAPETGQTVEGQTLSTGTVEQLQFALRAALAGILGTGERLPVIFDDALAHADDERLRGALEHAAALAHGGMQIVFFTQRADIERIAASLSARIVRLPNPA